MTQALATLAQQTISAQAAEAKQVKKAQAAAKAKKPAAKPASSKPAALAIKHRIVSNRPSSGPLLWAHTAAWLELSGMTAGKAFSKRDAIHVAGATAINYHLTKGTFEQVGDKIKLTAGGKHHFRTMADDGKIDPDQKAAFVALMKTGRTQAAVSIKNAAQIGAMPE